MRIAVYGGSFNPPHVGHALVAAWLKWTDHVDEVRLVPAFSHPFDKNLAPFDRRVAMCRALAETVGAFVRVDPIESELPTPSYTIDTLHELAARKPEDSIRLVVGADVLDSVHLWKDWDRIQESFSPIIVGRQGYAVPVDALAFPEVSSTEIRRRLRTGEPVDALVPRAVLDELGELYQ